MTCSGARPLQGGTFLGEGTTVTAFSAIVGFCRKSRGGGEGGSPIQGQGEGMRAGL